MILNVSGLKALFSYLFGLPLETSLIDQILYSIQGGNNSIFFPRGSYHPITSFSDINVNTGGLQTTLNVIIARLVKNQIYSKLNTYIIT